MSFRQPQRRIDTAVAANARTRPASTGRRVRSLEGGRLRKQRAAARGAAAAHFLPPPKNPPNILRAESLIHGSSYLSSSLLNASPWSAESDGSLRIFL